MVLLIALEANVLATVRLRATLPSRCAYIISRCAFSKFLASPLLAVPVRRVGPGRARRPALREASRLLLVALHAGSRTTLRVLAICLALGTFGAVRLLDDLKLHHAAARVPPPCERRRRPAGRRPPLAAMSVPSWALDYPALEERKFPERYSGDYYRDSLPQDLWEFENAVVDGDVFTVRRLLEAGVNPNEPLDANHMTALMISCFMGNWDLVQLLVEDFEADLDGPLSRSGLRAIDYAACQGYRFPNEHPITEYMKSKGSQHTWWGAVIACDFPRVKEYVENGQDLDEVNPVLWNGNAIFLAQEFGNQRIAQYLLTKGATVMVRNCHNIDVHEMKWSIGRGDAFFYKAQRVERQGAGVEEHYAPEHM
mmetsp:Transcript_74585/g.188556  ORF Transcript_74585/g.188556 Transcript_74585/m.188556 type:complete len:368 (+) Transcript_74585:1322-2425(+)